MKKKNVILGSLGRSVYIGFLSICCFPSLTNSIHQDHPLFVWSQLRSEFLDEILKLDAFETNDSSVCVLDPNPGENKQVQTRAVSRSYSHQCGRRYASSERGTIRRLALKVKTKSSV